MEVMAHVGVPEAERSLPQRLELSLCLELDLANAAKSERLESTVDYASLQQHVLTMTLARPRALIETLAEDLAMMILEKFKVYAVTVEVRKFILPETRHVAVKIRRTTN